MLSPYCGLKVQGLINVYRHDSLFYIPKQRGYRLKHSQFFSLLTSDNIYYVVQLVRFAHNWSIF